MAVYLVSSGQTIAATDLDQLTLLAGWQDLAALATTADGGTGAVTTSGGTTSGNGPEWRGPSDYWQATATSQWIKFDFGASIPNVRAVSFGTFNRNDGTKIPANYAIDYSTDNTTWTNLATVTGATAVAQTAVATSAFTARYIRITVNAFQSGQTVANVAAVSIFYEGNAAGYPTQPWLVSQNNNLLLVNAGGLKTGTTPANQLFVQRSYGGSGSGHMEAGKVTAANLTTGTHLTTAVTFSVAFGSTPTVVVGSEANAFASGTLQSLSAVEPLTVGTSGFTIDQFNEAGTTNSITGDWIATGG